MQGPGSTSGQGTRVHMPQLKMLYVATKTQPREISKYFKKDDHLKKRSGYEYHLSYMTLG